MIEQLFQSGNLFGLLDMFSGGALSKFSIFAMSITPYINASIILQLLKVVVPTLEQWSKEGVEGQKKVTQLTRGGTVLLGFIQALGMAYGLRSAINNPGIMSILLIAISLTAGTVFLMWIGERITEKGVGNAQNRAQNAADHIQVRADPQEDIVDRHGHSRVAYAHQAELDKLLEQLHKFLFIFCAQQGQQFLHSICFLPLFGFLHSALTGHH